jgi:hypothetical protein
MISANRTGSERHYMVKRHQASKQNLPGAEMSVAPNDRLTSLRTLLSAIQAWAEDAMETFVRHDEPHLRRVSWRLPGLVSTGSVRVRLKLASGLVVEPIRAADEVSTAKAFRPRPCGSWPETTKTSRPWPSVSEAEGDET